MTSHSGTISILMAFLVCFEFVSCGGIESEVARNQYISNDCTSRPVWLLGHAANCHRTLKSVLAEGGNGVEIDVASDESVKGTFWSVAHDHFVSASAMEEYNRSISSEEDYWVSLETYLKYDEMNDICLLWLDNKNDDAGYLKELVEYVHRITEQEYEGGLPPYSIIYGMYYVKDLDTYTTDGEPVLSWLRDNLKDNEGINVAWEELTEKGDDQKVIDLFEKYNFPYTKHLFSNGYHNSALVGRNSSYVADLSIAHSLMRKGKFCSRIAFWTAQSGWDADWFFDTEATRYRHDSIVKTDCDVVLTECNNDMVTPGSKNALKDAYSQYLDTNGKYYGQWNAGRCRLATQKDAFWSSNLIPIHIQKCPHMRTPQ